MSENQIKESQVPDGNAENVIEKTQSESVKFRCHFTIVIEHVFKKLWVLIVIVFFNVLDEIDDVIQYIDKHGFQFDEDMIPILIIIAGVLGIILVTLLFDVFQWSKTYISIVDNAIVLEKNTLFKKKSTIGIKNISNINTEQNVFEMIVGTCKVKLDTNSASTADKTDIDIVLKKDKAENFRRDVMRILKELERGVAVQKNAESGRQNTFNTNDNTSGSATGNTTANTTGMRDDTGKSKPEFYMDEDGNLIRRDGESDIDYGMLDEHAKYDVETENKDILCHGLYSLSIGAILLGLAALIISIIVFNDEMKGSKAKDFVSMLPLIIFCVITVFSAVGGQIKGFFRYYHFKAKRHQDKIYLSYGLFRKVNYTMPVDKINVITVKQTFIARMLKKYTVQVINIGMGDDENEESSFLLPYLSEERMREALNLLLPEFKVDELKAYDKQPKSCFVHKLCNIAPFFIGCFGGVIGSFVGGELELATYLLIGVIVLLAWILLVQILTMKYEGMQFGDNYVKIVQGAFGREYKYIEYKKVQYIKYNQGPIMKRLGNAKGELHVLAPILSRDHSMPYFESARMDEMNEKMMGNSVARRMENISENATE